MFLVVDDGVELLKRILAVFVEDAFVGLYVHDFSRDLGVASDVDCVHDLALDRELQLVDDRGVDLFGLCGRPADLFSRFFFMFLPFLYVVSRGVAEAQNLS